MKNTAITDSLSVKVNSDFNLRNRLNELPHSAWKRVNHKTLRLSKPRYHNIINGKIKRIFKVEIEAFCNLLNCSVDQFYDPSYAFPDFRTSDQKKKDMSIQDLVKV